jgi:membrane protein
MPFPAPETSPSTTPPPNAGQLTQAVHRAGLKLPWPELKQLISHSVDSWSAHNAPRLGASLAFYSLLSLAPLLLVIVSIVGLAFGHDAAQRQTANQIQQLVGPAAGKAASAFIQGSQNTTHGVIATIIGLLTLLFSASGVVIELRDALNLIWDSPTVTTTGFGKIKAYVQDRLLSFAIVVAIGFLLIVSLAVSAWIAALGTVTASLGPLQTVLMHTLNFVVSFVVIAVLFAAIYKVMPDVHIQWRDVALGGIVTSALFSVGKLVLGIYLGRASFASTYGAAASIVVLIAWVYYSAQIFFFGAEVTRAFSLRHGSHANEPAPRTRAATA